MSYQQDAHPFVVTLVHDGYDATDEGSEEQDHEEDNAGDDEGVGEAG